MLEAATKAKRILVADDDPGVSALLRRILSIQGYTVTSANDGITASQVADDTLPDLILLDLHLPRRDGFAVLLTLGSREATARIPVLMVTGASDEHETTARALGALGFLQKPFTRDEVIQAVESALGVAAHGHA